MHVATPTSKVSSAQNAIEKNEACQDLGNLTTICPQIVHMGFQIYEEIGYGLNLDLLTILNEVCANIELKQLQKCKVIPPT